MHYGSVGPCRRVASTGRLFIPQGHEEQSYRGRAKAPEFVLKPLMSKPRMATESVQMHADTVRQFVYGPPAEHSVRNSQQP